jgi:hypothetical protein
LNDLQTKTVLVREGKGISISDTYPWVMEIIASNRADWFGNRERFEEATYIK